MTRSRDNATNVAGDISGVTAGTGLSGGGTDGAVTLNLSTPVAATNGGTGLSTFTTGDIPYASASNTLAKLAIGSTDNVLKVSGGVPVWAAPAAGGLTELATGTLSGASVTVSNISGSYKHLQIIVRDVLGANSSALRLVFNGDEAANYKNSLASAFTYDENTMLFASQTFTSGNSLIWCEIPDYANSATPKIMRTFGVTQNSGTPNFNFFTHFNAYNGTAAITSVKFKYGFGNISSGTYFIYGVS